jgi:hypothetical protein
MQFFKNKPMLSPMNFGIKTKAKSPLDNVPLKGNIEEDSLVELTELQKGFQDRSKQENDRFKLSTDSEYWCCICFSSREQKEHFLKQTNLLEIGDKYLDGYKVAKKFNIELPKVKFQKT